MPAAHRVLKIYLSDDSPAGRRAPAQKLLQEVWLDFPSNVDAAREMAKAKAKALTKGDVRSVSALVGGGFSVSVWLPS